jgi:hypothetical protein
MPRTFCLLNHELTSKQTAELLSVFGSERVIYPPAWVSALWGEIPPGGELTKAQLEPFADWLRDAGAGDIAVLQGEAGASFALVDFALQKGLIPVHAVTKRIAQEARDGEKVRRTYIFEHICFRQYRYYRDLLEDAL